MTISTIAILHERHCRLMQSLPALFCIIIPYVAAVAMSPGRTTRMLSRVLSAWSLRNIIMFRFTGDLEYTAVIALASVCSRVCSSMAVPM